jgi:hypothetical protein
MGRVGAEIDVGRSSRRHHGIYRHVIGSHYIDDLRLTDGKRSGLVENK